MEAFDTSLTQPQEKGWDKPGWFVIYCKNKSIPKSSQNARKHSVTLRLLSVFWQGHKDLNPEPTVLETAALPIELYPYI